MSENSLILKDKMFLPFASVVSGVSSVTGLTCAGPNQSNPEINLSWLKPAGLSTGFVIQIDNQNHTLLSNSCSSQEKCNYTVSHLKYYTEYHVLVWTQNSDQYSPSVAIDCITGIKGQFLFYVIKDYFQVLSYTPSLLHSH